jgi:hypothetical protein
MNPPLSSQALIFAVIAVLICWRIFRRVRRLIGRQLVHPRRLVSTAIFFPLLAVLVALPALRNPELAESMAAGIVVGVALGLFGLRLTRFEVTNDGHFYVPNMILGVAISLLFIGRIIYRVGAIYLTTGNLTPETMQTFGRSPLTLALFGVVAAYYTTFAIGILSWHRKVRAEVTPAPDAAGTPLA